MLIRLTTNAGVARLRGMEAPMKKNEKTLYGKQDHSGVRWLDECPSHPDQDKPLEKVSWNTHHECLEKEMRCAYCGKRIDPYPCHGCGKFMTAESMHEDDGTHRCEECR
jgi:DNA-directed RNA polymerase subunit RPC12/RpoP